jgi:hypothetical protein
MGYRLRFNLRKLTAPASTKSPPASAFFSRLRGLEKGF